MILEQRVFMEDGYLGDVTAIEAIQHIEKILQERFGCTVSWAIETDNVRFGVGWTAGISYRSVLESIASNCGYVLLYSEKEDYSGKPYLYLSFMKRLHKVIPPLPARSDNA